VAGPCARGGVEQTAATPATVPASSDVWWSFAGSDGNRWLAAALDDIRDQSVQDDPLSIRVRSGTSAEQVRGRLHEVDVESLSLKDRVLDQAVEELKFNDALPELLASQVISRRFRADDAVSSVLSSPVRGVHLRD
jgi:hypothetical protein